MLRKSLFAISVSNLLIIAGACNKNQSKFNQQPDIQPNGQPSAASPLSPDGMPMVGNNFVANGNSNGAVSDPSVPVPTPGAPGVPGTPGQPPAPVPGTPGTPSSTPTSEPSTPSPSQPGGGSPAATDTTCKEYEWRVDGACKPLVPVHKWVAQRTGKPFLTHKAKPSCISAGLPDCGGENVAGLRYSGVAFYVAPAPTKFDAAKDTSLVQVTRRPIASIPFFTTNDSETKDIPDAFANDFVYMFQKDVVGDKLPLKPLHRWLRNSGGYIFSTDMGPECQDKPSCDGYTVNDPDFGRFLKYEGVAGYVVARKSDDPWNNTNNYISECDSKSIPVEDTSGYGVKCLPLRPIYQCFDSIVTKSNISFITQWLNNEEFGIGKKCRLSVADQVPPTSTAFYALPNDSALPYGDFRAMKLYLVRVAPKDDNKKDIMWQKPFWTASEQEGMALNNDEINRGTGWGVYGKDMWVFGPRISEWYPNLNVVPLKRCVYREADDHRWTIDPAKDCKGPYANSFAVDTGVFVVAP